MGIELPAELADVAASAGVRWPQADEEAMRTSAQAWRTAGTKITTLTKDADGTASQALSAVHGATGTAAKQHWHTFVAPDTGHLTSVAKGCTDAADRLDHAADQVGAAKVQIVRHLVSLAKNQDAAQQAAAAGHPTALAGLTTTVHSTAASVAQVNHSLTNSIRLDSTTTPGQPGQSHSGGLLGQNGLLGSNGLLGNNGPVGANGPLGSTNPLAANGPLGPHGVLSPAGPLGANGPLGNGPLGQTGLVGANGPVGAHGPLNVVQPVVAPVTHGVDQMVGPVVGPVGGHGQGTVLGLDPEHTGPIAPGTITAAAGSGSVLGGGGASGPGIGAPGIGAPGVGGTGIGGTDIGGTGIGGTGIAGTGIGAPGVGDPGPAGHGLPAIPVSPGVAAVPGGSPWDGSAPGVPGDPGPVGGHGPVLPTEAGATVAQSAAPVVAPAAEPAQGPAGIGMQPAAPVPAAPAAAPPPAATFNAPTPSFGTPMPPGGTSAPPAAGGVPVGRSVAPNMPQQGQNWSGRGGDPDVIGAPVAVTKSGSAGVRPGPRSAVAPQDPTTDVTALPGPAMRSRVAPRNEAVALFLVYLFPFGQLPKPASRPVRQLPPPAPETDFAAGLRFEPNDHPRSDLIDVAAALEREPEVSAHPGFAAEDPEVAELADGHDPLGGGNERDWDRRFLVRPPDADGGHAAEYAWPPGELFPEGGCDAGEPVVLAVDTVIDRFGTPEGRVFAEDGTPFARRSLPPDHLAAGYHRYRVTRELPMWRTLSAPWFGQSGGGVRYRAVHPAADLLALGYLTDITGTDNGH